jgi:hypothetical protein
MRTWHLAATTAMLLALAIWPTLWSPSGTSLVDADLRHQVVSEDDAADLDELATRVAALETAVAALQTSVADGQAVVASPSVEVEPTSTPISLVTLACGRPFASWGAATSDGIGVQLLQIKPSSEVDVVIEGSDVFVVDLAIDNLRDSDLTLALEDFVLLDCDDNEHFAVAGGLDPSIAPGELAAGNSTRGWLTFALPPGAQPAGFVYRIQSPGRTGAEVSCPLVDRSAPPAPASAASGGAGCSARGGSAG